MAVELPPGLILILGAALVPLLRGPLRTAYMLLLPVVALVYLLMLPHGTFGQFDLFGLELVTLRVDRLSLMFGFIFLIAAWLGLLYASHLDDTVQHVAALIYAGSAVGAVFSGDLISLFLFWEGLSVASVFLIWANRTETAYRTGMRYLFIQVSSGVLLMAGAAVQLHETGSIAFGALEAGSLAGGIILLAFGIKCAFPLLHTWLRDAYPAATIPGAVILSAFTTKVAVYALARGFAGTEILVPIGAIMAVFPIFYGMVETDLRRVVAYSLISQLGFMVVGIGIGTELALNGAAAHALASVLYQGLLFMATGAVLHRTGTIDASDLGGLYRSMPWTAGFCIIAAASISAVPFSIGFATKSLTLAAVVNEEYFWTWLALLFAGVGVFLIAGIRVPYLAFFGRDSGRRCAEPPGNMLVAMAITAGLCLLLGVVPGLVYGILPFGAEYSPYTVTYILGQLQLLVFAAAAFAAVMWAGLYPTAIRVTTLDADWIYRKPGKWLGEQLAGAVATISDELGHLRQLAGREFVAQLYVVLGPQGLLARTWTIGFAVLLITVLLGASLMLNFLLDLPDPASGAGGATAPGSD